MNELNLDRARLKHIRHRVGRAASFKFRFFQGGNPYPINGLAFEWFAKFNKDLPEKEIKLTTADELSISGAALNELVVPITEANANLLKPHPYYYELICTTRMETWYNGKFIAHNGEFDAGSDADEINGQINTGDVVIDVTITLSEKSKFLGKYVSLVALEAAHADASAGDYAHVDAGPGSDSEQYIWDDEEGWVQAGNAGGLNTHLADFANPHQVTKGQVGLSNVDNTADADKSVSTSQAAADAAALASANSYTDGEVAALSDIVGTAQLNDPSLTTFISRVATDLGTTEAIQYTYDESEYLKRLGFHPDFPFYLTPISVKASKLFAIKPVDGSGDLTFTRSSTANRINAAGTLETLAAATPRIDYSDGDPVTLMEPTMVNLIVGPSAPVTQDITVTATDYTLSFFGTGTITLSGVYSGALVGTGSGRVKLTFVPTAGTLTLTVTGTVTNAQLEARNHVTSYRSGTRTADSFSLSGLDTKGFVGSNTGTWYFHLKDNTPRKRGGVNSILGISNASGYSIRVVRMSGNSRFQIQSSPAGGGGATTLYGTLTDELKVAVTWNELSVNVYVNGIKVVTNAAVTSTDFTVLESGGVNGLVKIAAIGLGPAAIADKRAIELTYLNNQILSVAGLQQYGTFQVDNYGAVGDGVTDDTAAIRAAISAAGANHTISFTPNKTYIISKSLSPGNGQTWRGNGATIKRCDVRFTTLAAEASSGVTAITVVDASVFGIGDILSVLDNGGPYGGLGDDEDSQQITITEINGNVVTFTPALTLAVSRAGSPFPVGSEVVKIFDMVANVDTRVTYLDLTFDGNKASNNKTYSWESNWTIHHLGTGGIIQRCRFFNTPCENIAPRSNTRIIDCYAEGLNGSFTHISTIGAVLGDVIIARNIINGVSLIPGAIMDHNEAAFTFSANSTKVIIAENIVLNAGQSFCGNISASDTHVTAVGNIMIGGDGVFDLSPAVAGMCKNIKLIGNHFENLNYLRTASHVATRLSKGFGTDHIVIQGNKFINTRFVFAEVSNLIFTDNDIVITDDYVYPVDSKVPLSGSTHLFTFVTAVNVKISDNTIDNRQVSSEVYTHGFHFSASAFLKSNVSTNTAYSYTRNISITDNVINGFKHGISAGDPLLLDGKSTSYMNFVIQGNNITNHQSAAVYAIKADPGMQVMNNTIVGAATYGIDVIGVSLALSATHNGPIIAGNYIVGPATSIRIGNGATHYNARVHGNFHSGAITDNSGGNSISSGNYAIIAEAPLIKNVRQNPDWY